MVAINFHPTFVDPIRSGSKTQTIRRSARAEAGDTLQLYTGQRTLDDGTAAIVIALDGIDYILTMTRAPKQRPRPSSN